MPGASAETRGKRGGGEEGVIFRRNGASLIREISAARRAGILPWRRESEHHYSRGSSSSARRLIFSLVARSCKITSSSLWHPALINQCGDPCMPGPILSKVRRAYISIGIDINEKWPQSHGKIMVVCRGHWLHFRDNQ